MLLSNSRINKSTSTLGWEVLLSEMTSMLYMNISYKIFSSMQCLTVFFFSFFITEVNVMNTSVTSISSLNELQVGSLKKQSPDGHSSIAEDSESVTG